MSSSETDNEATTVSNSRWTRQRKRKRVKLAQGQAGFSSSDSNNSDGSLCTEQDDNEKDIVVDNDNNNDQMPGSPVDSEGHASPANAERMNSHAYLEHTANENNRGLPSDDDDKQSHHEQDDSTDFPAAWDTSETDNEIQVENVMASENEINITNFNERFDQEMYTGANITLADSLLAILSFATSFHLSGTATESLLKLIELHLPKPNKCPTSLYKFRKFFEFLNCPGKISYSCAGCGKKYVTKVAECENCSSISFSTLLYTPITSQVAKKFERKEFYKNLQHRFTRQAEDDVISDIYDSKIYQIFMNNGFLSIPSNISFTFSGDGLQVYESNTETAWAMSVTINELPAEIRFKRENIIVFAIWFGPKPKGNVMLEEMQEDFSRMSRGIKVKAVVDGQVKEILCKGVLLFQTGDLPAKHTFLNMTFFNGAFGCLLCTYEGESFRTIKEGTVRIYRYQENYNMRTTEECRQLAKLASETQIPQLGVKGPTRLSLIMPYYIEGTGIDPMHGDDLGVGLKLLELLFGQDYKNEHFSVAHMADVVNERLSKLTTPNFVKRTFPPLSKKWKALLYQKFFRYMALPVLWDILSPVLLDHLSKYVTSLHLLDQDNISKADLQLARTLLTEFARDFEENYTPRALGINIHNLNHKVDSVINTGPLRVMTCYHFESHYGFFSNFIHGSTYMQVQIARSLSVIGNIQELINTEDPSEAAKYCESVIFRNSLINKTNTNEIIEPHTYSVGKYIYYLQYPLEIQNNLRALGIDVTSIRVKRFFKLLKGNRLFISRSVNRSSQSASFCCNVEVNGVLKICIIEYFLKICKCQSTKGCDCDSKLFFVVVKHCDIIQSNFYSLKNKIFEVKPQKEKFIHHVKAINSMNYFYKVDSKMFAAVPCNSVERE